MRRRSAPRRLIWIAAAFLQLLLPPVLTALDARLETEARSQQAAAHVESHQSPTCARAHPSECAICHHVVASRSALAADRLLGVPGRAAMFTIATRTTHKSDAERSPSLARAPPLS